MTGGPSITETSAVVGTGWTNDADNALAFVYVPFLVSISVVSFRSYQGGRSPSILHHIVPSFRAFISFGDPIGRGVHPSIVSPSLRVAFWFLHVKLIADFTDLFSIRSPVAGCSYPE